MFFQRVGSRPASISDAVYVEVVGALHHRLVPVLFAGTSQALVGAIAAALTTYLAIKFLLRFFKTNRLTPFGIYCIAAGLILSLAFAL